MRIDRLLLAATAVLCLSTPSHARTLKIATIAPEGSAWMREMRGVAKTIEEQTQGRVAFKFYPSGVMGSDRTVLRKIRAGQLQGGAFTSGALSQAYPDIQLYGTPLLFRSYAEVDYVRARMDEGVIQGLERAGFVALAITDGGFAYLMSQQPMRRVDELPVAKVWLQEGDVMSQTAFELAGVSPVQLPLADVYTALQTGLVDTVAGPPMGVIALQWHTKVDYLMDVPLTYLTGVFALDRRAFDKLRPEDQVVVRQVVREAAEQMDAQHRESEENARAALREQGIAFLSPDTPAEVERWRALMDQALVVLREKQLYSQETMEEIRGHLEDYRAVPREGNAD
jgi:TRAP-type C4-dicarboxylate transport system substrate-binding protein